jgi:two-component system NtrC family sensor kinase
MIKSSVGKIYDHGNSTTRIVKDMQRLLKEKSRDFFEIDLSVFVETRAKTAYQEFTSKNKSFNGELKFDLTKKPSKARILPPEFGNVISIIIDNSLYILAEKSKFDSTFKPQIVVSTELTESEIILKFKDNGKGISQRDLEKIFSPFFTTKPTSQGTGLGLFMSKDIVQMHKGNINIYSKEGIYTEVVIALPIIIETTS